MEAARSTTPRPGNLETHTAKTGSTQNISTQLITPPVSGGTSAVVYASCACCGSRFASLNNAWEQVTASYFLELLSPGSELNAESSKHDLKEAAQPGPARRNHKLLADCTVQRLVCRLCSDPLAFRCVGAENPASAEFVGRIFYKLHKINLIDTNTNAPVSPDVRSQRAELQSSEREHSPPRSRERSHSSADPVHASKPDIDDMVIDEADNEAIVRVRSGYEWRDVHKAWEQKTQLELSPVSFGERIMKLQESRTASSRTASQRTPPPPTSSTPPVTGRALRPLAPGFQPGSSAPASAPPVPQPSSREPIDGQRGDISRLEHAVGSLQLEMQYVRKAIDDLRSSQLVSSRASFDKSSPIRPEDQNSLHVLSESVSNMSARLGVIESLKLDMDLTKQRLRRLENDGGSNAPSTPILSREVVPPQLPPLRPSFGSASSGGPPPISAGLHSDSSTGSTRWNAVNSVNKRKTPPSMEDMAGDAKRHYGSISQSSPSAHYAIPRGSTSAIAPPYDERQLPPPPAQFGAPPPAMHPRKYSPRSLAPLAPPPLGRPPMHPESTVVPEAHYASPVPAGSPYSRSPQARRGSGGAAGLARPAPIAYAPATAFQPANATILTPASMAATGGNPTPAASSHGTAPSGKRTRQKPVRNAEGILIRKDGKPDQRSISSPMNLKKVHARKTGGNERAGGSGSVTGDDVVTGGESGGAAASAGENIDERGDASASPEGSAESVRRHEGDEERENDDEEYEEDEDAKAGDDAEKMDVDSPEADEKNRTHQTSGAAAASPREAEPMTAAASASASATETAT